MSQYIFMVTSAINTKFGVYKSDERLEQTLATIKSIRDRVPNPKIFILELAGRPLTEDQKTALVGVSDHLIDFTTDPSVVGLYDSTDNWDIVKNVTEVMCFGRALETLHKDERFVGSQRIFKVSGRYVFNDHFDIKFYDEFRTQPFVVIGEEKPSQFPYQVTLCERQYMARLWSWPTTLNEEIIKVYQDGLKYMWERLQAGGYVDIEHMLFKFLDKGKLINRPMLGIEGNIAPNGHPIKN